MKLTKLERLTLCNQYLILEKLYPQNAKEYEQKRIALEKGFELNYQWVTEELFDEMSEEECRKILDILDMFRIMHSSLEKYKDIIEFKSRLYFPGFDGNNEPKQLDYVEYYLIDLGRYEELQQDKKTGSYNTHKRAMPYYEKMMNIFERLVDDQKYDMSSDTLNELLNICKILYRE